MPVPEAPPALHLDPATLPAKELRQAQEQLWEWLQAAETAALDDAPDDELVDAARAQLNAIIRERRDLHDDEPAPRSG